LQRDPPPAPAHARIVRRAQESFRNRSYSSSSQYSTAGSGPREHDVVVLGVLGENLSGVEVLDDFAGIIEESMRTRIGESVRLMI
jgi:hypothetical protein